MLETMLRSDGFRWVSSAAAAVYSVALTSTSGQLAAASPSLSAAEEKFGCAVASAACSQINTVLEFEKKDPAVEKRFAPRFDGMRFIETLVTAHR